MMRQSEFLLHELLDGTVEANPDQIALVDGPTTTSYAELASASRSLALALLEAGIRPGDRICLYLEKSLAAVAAIFAASRIGAAFVIINPLLKPPQVRYILNNCGARALIGDTAKLSFVGSEGAAGHLGTDELATIETIIYQGDRPPDGVSSSRLVSLASVLRSRPPCRLNVARPVIETDLAAILYTSGSTGQPKGVALSQRNLVVGAQIVARYLANTATDRILSVLPLSFDYGLNQLTTATLVGATLVLQHSSLPGDLWRSLRHESITGLAGVPSLWPLLLRAAAGKAAQQLPCLRYLTNSGGRIPAAYLERLRQLLPTTRIVLMYGLTEAFRSTYLPPEEIERGSECIGKPIPNTDIRVVDRAGRECAPGEVGELVHRGPTVALGYWGQDEATRRVFRPSPFLLPGLGDSERVVYSGDLVRRDEDGYLYFVARNDQLIKTQGYRLSPEEIENLLISSGLIHEACAFGVDDLERGQRIVAVISASTERTSLEAQLRAYCLQHAPAYMVPSEFCVCDELPKTPSGKLDRQAVQHVYTQC